MNRALLLICAVLLLASVIAGCGGDNDSEVKSGPGESCTKTDDCESGLICVALVCVQDGATDGDTTDGDTTDGDTTDDDTADGDASDGDITDDDTADGDTADGDTAEATEDGDTTTDGETIEFGLTWVSIPGGNFEMGCSRNDDDCFRSEEPRHNVNVSGFRMTKYEITNAQYAEFLNNRGHNNCLDYPCLETGTENLRLGETGGFWSVISGYENHPVVEVPWYGAKAFCEASGGRLPSEAEWEYAARGGTTTKFYCGDNWDCLGDIACWGQPLTCPAGQYDPNDFGLYDMLGNVAEWVEDCYHEDYTDAPDTGEVWSGGKCSIRMRRGGSWDNTSSYRLRVSGRNWANPTTRDDQFGFRCARDVQ